VQSTGRLGGEAGNEKKQASTPPLRRDPKWKGFPERSGPIALFAEREKRSRKRKGEGIKGEEVRNRVMVDLELKEKRRYGGVAASGIDERRRTFIQKR